MSSFFFFAYLVVASLRNQEKKCFQQALAEMLKQNQTIRSIRLHSNRITNVGAKATFEPQSSAAFEGFEFLGVAGIGCCTPCEQEGDGHSSRLQ